MSYRLRAGEGIQEALRRIAREEIGEAAEDLAGAEQDLHRAVHEFRKRCKKIRGLLRLVRPAFPEYDKENAWFRDRSRTLSALRDATSSRECLAGLVARYRDDLADSAFTDVGEWLERRQLTMSDGEGARATLERLRMELPAAGERAGGWSLEAAGAELTETGMRQTYRRARNGMRRAAETNTAAAFHEWRKRVKYCRYQTALISPAWPPVLEAEHHEFRRLSDLLGDEHDLAVLRATLTGEAPAALQHAVLLALCDRRSAELRDRALALGRRLCAEKPGAHAARRGAILAAWREEQADSESLDSESDGTAAMRRCP